MELVVFSGTAHRVLGAALARELGSAPGACVIERFPDGEVHLELQQDVRGRAVALVQPTPAPVGEHLLELLLLADACQRSGASSLTAVLPYLGYARQDRSSGPGEALGARVVADVLASVRFERLVAVDLHTTALEGYFGIPLEHVSAMPELADAVRPRVGPDSIVVSPDLGGLKRAERFARSLGLPVAVVDKARHSGAEVSAHEVLGEVRGRRPILVDDLVSTGGTIAAAAEVLRARGCVPDLTVVATHALLVGPALARLGAAGVRLLVSTDSLPPSAPLPFPHQVVGLAPLLARTLRRLATPTSAPPVP